MRSRFTFYSLLTGLLIGLGVWLRPEDAHHFATAGHLWRDPVIAGALCGIVAAWLGVYMLLNRIVFMSLAIAQGAGFGIFLSFWIAGLWGLSLEESPLSLALGLLVAGGSALLFARLRHSRHFTEESLIGLLYVVASGLIVLLGDRIPQGKHAIDNLLFGNAVAVTPEALGPLAVLSTLILAVHLFWRREFLYVSADPQFMAVRGLSTGFWQGALFLTLTVGITITMRTMGSLPVFGLMVIPPFIALRRAHNLREAFSLAIALGALLPPLGYFFSFLFNLPTGASSIGVGLVYLLASFLESKSTR